MWKWRIKERWKRWEEVISLKQRKFEARAHRQECLHATGTNETVQVPQPKNLIKNNNVIKVEKKSNPPVVTEIAKRGRGRPRKVVSEKINNVNKAKKHGLVPVVAKGRK